MLVVELEKLDGLLAAQGPIDPLGLAERGLRAADVERVADWYLNALRDVLPYIGDKHKELLTEILKQAADQVDVRKRMELLALLLDDVVGSK